VHSARPAGPGVVLLRPRYGCLVSGESRPPEGMLRFVVGPDDRVVPDVGRRLPGRGLWVDATVDAVRTAVTRNLFSRGARRAVRCEGDLPEQVERLLLGRALDLVGLARRAGRAVCGMAKVQESLRRGRAGLILVAADAGGDGVKHLGSAPRMTFVESQLLGGIFGREAATYVAIGDEGSGNGFASRIATAIERWNRYRGTLPSRQSGN